MSAQLTELLAGAVTAKSSAGAGSMAVARKRGFPYSDTQPILDLPGSARPFCPRPVCAWTLRSAHMQGGAPRYDFLIGASYLVWDLGT